MYSTYNEGKSVIAERFIRTLKNKIYKYMTSVLKNGYAYELNDIVNKYNNTYHGTIKMKRVEVKSNTYINSSKEINNEDLKFKIGDIVRILNDKNIFGKCYVPNWSEEVFEIKKFKTLCCGHMLLVILTEKKLLEDFMKKNCKKQIRKTLELKSNKKKRR